MLSVKFECLNKMILFGESSLRRALREFCVHYHAERPHQGIGNVLIALQEQDASPTGEILETERLGGLLHSYHRAA